MSDAKATLSDLLQEAETLLNDVTAEDAADTSVLEGLSIVFESATGAVIGDISALSSLTRLDLHGNRISEYSPVEFVELLFK